MEALTEAMNTLDGHVDGIDTAPTNRGYLVELAGRVRKSLEGMYDMLELYNWLDRPSDGAYGVTPLMSP